MATELDSTPVSDNATADTADAQTILARVRELVERDDVLEARRILAAARERGTTSRRLEHWQSVLAPPKAKPTGQATGGSIAEITAWLRRHGAAYQGQWVALKEGELIGANVSRVQLHRLLQDAGKLKGAVFIRL